MILKMNYLKNGIALACLAITFVLSSCKKEDSIVAPVTENNAASGTISYKRDGELITVNKQFLVPFTNDKLTTSKDISPSGNYYSWISKSKDTLRNYTFGVIKPISSTDTTFMSILLFANSPVSLANKTFPLAKFTFPYSYSNGIAATAFCGITSEAGSRQSTADVTSLTGSITFSEVNELTAKASGTFTFDIQVKRQDNGKTFSYKVTEGQFKDLPFQKF